jgi:ketosteroid isomerase-like protein
MKNFLSIFSLSAILMLSACQPPTVRIDLDQVKRSIQSLEDDYANALNNQDFEAAVALYHDEFMAMRPEQPAITSKAELLADMQASMGSDSSGAQLRFEVINVMAAGDLVVETGRDIATLPSGEERYGKYLAVWKKAGDKYLIVRDMNSSDADYDDDDDEEDSD